MNKGSADNILSVHDLQIMFKSEEDSYNEVVKSISFDLRKGEILGIVGESGSGKSVTALSIMQLLPTSNSKIADDSMIIYCDRDQCTNLLSLSEEEMTTYRGAKIAMVFQEPMTSMNPTMKCGLQVLETVMLHLDLDKVVAKAYVIDLFNKVDLPDPERIYNAYPHQLSGGQIQRIMISMALAGKPDILIADEPTTALDVTVQKEILSLLKEIRKELGMSIMFISHDLAVINEICDRVMVMRKGSIVEYGITDELFNHPKDSYTKGLIASRPPDGVKMSKLPTVDDFLNNEGISQFDFINKWKYSNEEILDRLSSNKNAPIVLSVEDVTKVYKTRIGLFRSKSTNAVKGASFLLREGEILGIVGESGSGKSTISRMICRLLQPSSGKILYKSEDIWLKQGKALKGYRKDCQIIFQDPYSSLNPRMRIGKAIMEPMEVHRLYDSETRKEKVLELLEDVGLDRSHFDRYPHEFSGGQRQRIVIARALALKPKLLICDECVSALDVSIQSKVLNLLFDIKSKYGLSILFISHDLSVVQFFADRILVMKEGEIVESGDAMRVYNEPQEEYTRKLLAAVPRLKRAN